MNIKTSIEKWYALEKSLGMGWGHYAIGAGLLALFIWLCIAFANDMMGSYEKKKEVERYSYNCATNKGIAVRDLEGRMRCVPMFSALAAKKG